MADCVSRAVLPEALVLVTAAMDRLQDLRIS